MTSPVILRISCLKEKHRWDSFRNQNFDNLPQLIVCGDKSIDEPFKLDGDVLYLKCRDLWEDLPEKMIALYNAMLDPAFDKYDYYIKCDADVAPGKNFSKDNLDLVIDHKDYIGSRLHKPPAGGRGVYHLKKYLTDSSPWKGKPCTCPKFLSTQYALGGSGYILSKKAVKAICLEYSINDFRKVRKAYIYEDSMVGILLKKYNIYPVRGQLYLQDKRGGGAPPRRRRRGEFSRRRKSRVAPIKSANRSMSLVRARSSSNSYKKTK